MANEDLSRLASAYGITTEFWDWKGQHTQVDDDAIVAILGAMDVDATTPEAITAAIEAKENEAWRSLLPDVVVVTEKEQATVEVHVTDGASVSIRVELETGGVRQLQQTINDVPARCVDGVMVGEASFLVPTDLPTGYHTLRATSEGRTTSCTLIVTPAFLGMPPGLEHARLWGYGMQLYSVRSHASWGIGDLIDLADFCTFAGAVQEADYVLINPIHAAQVRGPIDDSPYLPSSRRFINPIYTRPERIVEYATLSEADRVKVAELRSHLMESKDSDLIIRDECWPDKKAALRLIFDAGRSAARQIAFHAYCERAGFRLTQFATWCALSDEYGSDWHAWPEEYRSPDSPAVRSFQAANPAEIEFYQWLQWIAACQLSDAQQAAVDSGMASGIVTDLAVGVGVSSADTWMMNDMYAWGMSVGAPPDAYNQLGQNWGQPPWRPDALAKSAYRPLRDMMRAALAQAGGVRIDHILGMFRLWWIPEGHDPRHGAYVRYNHEAMIGIILLEAQRANAFVVGEDLGTVEGWVRGYLSQRGILGTSMLWFEYGQDGKPLAPEYWRRYAMASVVSHDLPPSAGYITGEHVRLRSELGLLTESVDDEMAHLEHDVEQWHEAVTSRGLFSKSGADDIENRVLALYRYLGQTPCQVLNLALVDAVGDVRIQNQPGTSSEYPNWKIPLSGPEGEPIYLDDLFTNPRVARIAAVMNRAPALP